MSEGYGNGSVGSGKYRTPAARPSKGTGTARVLIVLLILALLAAGATGVFLLRGEKPFAAYGDTGSANVMELQQWLTRLGCYDGSVTGDFDTATYDAYWDYCTAHGLTASRDGDGGLIVSLAEFEAMTACTAVPTASPSPTPTHTGYITPTPTAEPTATPTVEPTITPSPTPPANPYIDAEDVQAGDYEIATYNDGTCEITGYTGTAAELSIPNELSGYRVTSIGDSAFMGCYSLSSITIPDSVSSIGHRAFFDCYSLTTVTIPNSVTSIRDQAFEYCPNLTLKVPASSHAEQYAIDNSIPYMYDKPDYESEVLGINGILNRESTLTVTLPEHGYVSQVVSDQDIDGDGDGDVLYAATCASDEYPTQTITLTNLANRPAGEYTLTFIDISGHSNTETMKVGRSTYDLFITEITQRPVDGYINKGNVIVSIEGVAGEDFSVTLDSQTKYGTFDAEGKASISFESSDITRNSKIQFVASYINVETDGQPRSVPFQYDDYCNQPIIFTKVHEDIFIITGIAEEGSEVYISYPDYAGKYANTVAKVDAYGFFSAELERLMEGDTIRVTVIDPANNYNSCTLTVVAEDALGRMSAFAMGKLYSRYNNTDHQWLNSACMSVDELKEGITLPILAANAFIIGEFTAKMDDIGFITYEYEIYEDLAVELFCYVTFTDTFDYDAFATHAYADAKPGEAFSVDSNSRYVWIYAEFTVDVEVDAMMETFQLEPLAESEMLQKYIILQRNKGI